MNKTINIAVIGLMISLSAESQNVIPQPKAREVKTDLGLEMQPDSKIKWMLDCKLGMFIHWGLYAGPAKGEWYMENNGIKPEEYRKLAYPESGDQYFDARDFDPDKWADLAKEVGMKYMTMVTEHHDGYALFDSKYMNAFTSVQTHNKDFVKAFVEACRSHNMKVGLYKTLINWRYPGYYDVYGTNCKKNKFGYVTDISHKESARLMKEELYCQTKELMTKYGKIDQLFWDGGWLAQEGTDADGAFFWEPGKFMSPDNQWQVNPLFQDIDKSTGKPLGLMGIVRKYQPDLVANLRSGWCGDYTCEEGGGPVKGDVRSGVVEKCMSVTSAWGYNTSMEDEKTVMSLQKMKRIFSDCIVRNMCLLLNVGPDRHGNIPQPVVKRLHEFGSWVNADSIAIYGTRGGPWNPVEGQYGFCYKNNVIYVYFLGGYTSDTFTLPLVNKGMKVLKAYTVEDKCKVKVTQKGQTITASGIHPKKDDITVMAIVFKKNIF